MISCEVVSIGLSNPLTVFLMILISYQMIRLAQSIDAPIGVSEFRPEGPLVIIIGATRTDLMTG